MERLLAGRERSQTSNAVLRALPAALPDRPAFRVFGFVTFRTAFASLTALFLCIILDHG